MTIATDAANAKRAVLLLGHGSKLSEANETLRKVAASVESSGGYDVVLPAFLQLEEPGIPEAVESLVSRGFTDITVMPYFLYTGAHVRDDIPAELEAARARHPEVCFTMTESLGFDERLVDMAVERIEAMHRCEQAGPEAGPFAVHPIEAESMRIIDRELDLAGLPPMEAAIVKRVVHTTADLGFKEIIRFSPGAVEAGVRAIRGGCCVITDVNMVRAGIMGYRLAPFGSRVFCFSSDAGAARAAATEKITKTAAAMRKAAGLMDGAIVAVGNAPTALRELLRLVREHGARPALVVGTPVGFVGAAESKDELMASECEYISTEGGRGGSTVAAAIVNAIAIEAGAASRG